MNGGHNDAMVALGLLGVVLLLATRPHAHRRMGAAARPSLVKISIGFAIIPLALWTATALRQARARPTLLAPVGHRRRRR